MFVLDVLVYPAMFALLCVGAGLLVDRVAGGRIPAALLAIVGLAALVGVSQLATDVNAVAPATPWLMAAVAIAGFALGIPRARALLSAARGGGLWPLLATAAVFVIALAPVLFAGRPTLSDYMVLTDSALHIVGADYLVAHGQHLAHLDLANSYGQYLMGYYSNGYPSGADTLFGGSSRLLGLPLIWTFQPFNATVLALCAGPAWVLARRMGLRCGWAALAAVVASVPALVYAYELIASVKEIVALPLVLALGALVVSYPRWRARRASDVLPFALIVAAGISALGVAFGAWAAGATAVFAVVVILDGTTGTVNVRDRHLAAAAAAGVGAAIVASLPTWSHVSASVQISQAIATTKNPGNLPQPLSSVQVLGTWLTGNYHDVPIGTLHTLTYAFAGVVFLAAGVGALYLLVIRARALLAWSALMVGVLVVVTVLGGTWANAKTLMLTSPVMLLLAWASVAALLRRGWRVPALGLAALLTGGVLASDFLQYRGSDLAPTARYQEMASLNTRFAGKGPALFTDFDEYSLYVLRGLDIGGPDFLEPPPGLAYIANGHGGSVNVNRAAPRLLRHYRLMIMRRDPAAPRPPAAYRLVWQGTYYDVWRRTPNAPLPVAQVVRSGSVTVTCKRIRPLAVTARARGAVLIAGRRPLVEWLSLDHARHSRGWVYNGWWLSMSGPGSVSGSVLLPHAGSWNVWLRGEIMRAVVVRVDGHVVGTIADQVAGQVLNPNTMTPLRVRLAAGRHRVTITRGGAGLVPGDAGSAELNHVFFAPARGDGRVALVRVSATHWRRLCGTALDWVEAVRAKPQAAPSASQAA